MANHCLEFVCLKCGTEHCVHCSDTRNVGEKKLEELRQEAKEHPALAAPIWCKVCEETTDHI